MRSFTQPERPLMPTLALRIEKPLLSKRPDEPVSGRRQVPPWTGWSYVRERVDGPVSSAACWWGRTRSGGGGSASVSRC